MSRTEFEPMSITATGARSLLTIIGRSALAGLDQAREARRHVPGERRAAAGQAWIGHEIVLGAERLVVRRRRHTLGAAVGHHPPALQIVLEIRHHDLIEDLLVHCRVIDRHHGLYPAVKVARHHVGGADIDYCLAMRKPMTGAEAIDAREIEEAAHDAHYVDILRKARHAGAQAANAAHHEVDLHARPARLIERIDDLVVHERVHLHPDGRRAPRLGVIHLLANMIENARSDTCLLYTSPSP